MRRGSGLTLRSLTVILGVSLCLVALVCTGAYAAEDLFPQFKGSLEKRIDERILTIVGWVPVEAGDPFKSVIIGVREPMMERLESAKKEFLADIDNKKSEIQKALPDRGAIKTQVDKYSKAANAKLIEHYIKSRAKLAVLLTSKPLSGKQMKWIGGAFVVAFIGLIVGIVIIFVKAHEEEGPEPARLIKGTVRSVIAMAITYLIVLLALTDFLINQRIGGYLTAAFTTVILFYFGTRAIDAFYARTPGFSYSKTQVDGTKEKIKGHKAPEIVKKIEESRGPAQDKINEMVANELQKIKKKLEKL